MQNSPVDGQEVKSISSEMEEGQDWGFQVHEDPDNEVYLSNRVTRNSAEVNIDQRLGDSGDNFPGPSLAILGVDNDLRGSVGCLKEKV